MSDDIPKISDSSDLINALVDATTPDTDVMTALQNAIVHRDSCTKTGCPLCGVFRKYEQKRRDERFGWGEGKIRVDETMELRFLISGKAGEQRRFEHTVDLGPRMLTIVKLSMTVLPLNRPEQQDEDGDIVTISDWVRGDEPVDERFENHTASFFKPNPLGSGILFATLKDGGKLGFTAHFKEAATLSVSCWGQVRTRRG